MMSMDGEDGFVVARAMVTLFLEVQISQKYVLSLEALLLPCALCCLSLALSE